MKDIAGQPLAVGDTVAIALTGYRQMVTGKILRFTPKGMKVHFINPCRATWSAYTGEETFREPKMVCKVSAA